MNMLVIPKIILTPKDAWPDLERAHPSLLKLLLSVVVPLSLLPPLLLYHAGTHYGEVFAAGFGAKPWATIAVVFFSAEVLTFLGMGWFINQVATVYKVRTSTYDVYLLAAITPIPLWLSSLALLVPNLAFNFAVVSMAMAISCVVIYRGIYALCHMHEEIIAAAITQIVMGAALITWALLLLIIVAF